MIQGGVQFEYKGKFRSSATLVLCVTSASVFALWSPQMSSNRDGGAIDDRKLARCNLAIPGLHDRIFAQMAKPQQLEGYKGFGSFHSDNVEELIRIPDDVYVPPPLPAAVADIHAALEAWEHVPFGAGHRHRFMLDSDFTFVNHGAFGAPLRCRCVHPFR